VGSLSYSIAVDRIPVFVSAPAANPNPAIVNLAVEFSTAVDLPDAVSSWDFGDGAPVSSGLAVEHIYVTEGDFQVVVTARNPRTQAAAMATLSLNVGHTAVLPDTLATRQTHGLIKFATTGEDRATVTSMLQLPGRLSVKGTTLILGIGGLARTFVFGASGNAVLADASAHVRIVGQTKSGAIARVSVKLSGALKAAITSGAALDAQGLPLKTPLAIDLGGTAFSDIVSLNFKKARGGVQAKY
jgi:PKD repeat protein